MTTSRTKDCVLKQTAAEHPRAACLLAGKRRWCYAEFDAAVDRVADTLKSLKVGRRHRVALEAVTSPDLLVCFWALLRRGATVAPYSPRWTQEELAAARERASIDVLLTSQDQRDLCSAQASRVHTAFTTRPSVPTSHRDARIATIIFSSGSTGLPKAIAHRLDAHLQSAKGSNQNLPLAIDDRWLMSLPLFHVAGLGIVFRCILAGATIALPIADEDLIETVRGQCPTHLSLVPTQLRRLMNVMSEPPAQLRAVLLGGAPLPRELNRAAIDAGWPLFTTYGLSEMASQVTTGRCAEAANPCSAGKVLPGRELMLSEAGEILVRGATLFEGYLEASGIHRPLTAQGWFATGDLARMDERGDLSVIGRRDNMFVSGGENIHPEEIEHRLLELTGVLQAIVVAVPNRDYGQRPVAFVELENTTIDVVKSALRQSLTRFKIPDHFLAWPETKGLKPNRNQLAKIAASYVASQ